MRSAGRRLLVLAASCAALLAVPLAGAANADVFGSISMLSASSFGQAEYAHDPVVSEDGRYVVFDGSVAGVIGVWRRATSAGAPFEQVASGAAVLPSVSADGRYVSFTTNQGASLPADTNGQILTANPPEEAPGVYVRDMDLAPSEPGAFTLASAKDHSAQSLTYEFPGADPEEVERDEPALGATAAGRSAITADGRTVAFVTTAPSDLAGPGTPPLQVAVRHLDSEETALVSVRYDPETNRAAVDPETGEPEPVQQEEGRYGAVWTHQGNVPRFSVSEGTVTRPYSVPPLLGASISADGSAVAWMGGQISEQARTLSGEVRDKTYAEPLWRRIDAGPLEPTRRVTGGSDPEAPGCLAAPEPDLPATPVPGDPCQGPLAAQVTGTGVWNGEAIGNFIPRLSANGDDVAFLATAPVTADAGGFGLGTYNSDAFWVDMAAPDKDAGLKQLTQFASGETHTISTNADITDIGISPDGTQVAFTTKRTVFPLGEPGYVSQPAAVPGLMEIYDADVADGTLTRVTHGYEGGAASHPEPEHGNEDPYEQTIDGALSPSFTSTGEYLAFSSTASNLVFGDGNTPLNVHGTGDGADAFLVSRVQFSSEPTPQTISPAPANPTLAPPWKLLLAVSSLANGRVQIRVTVPAAGRLTASATSAIPSRGTRRGRPASRTVRRVVARAAATARPGVQRVTVELELSAGYRSLSSRTGGLPGTITLTFSAAGHPTLRRTVTVRFVHRHGSKKKGRR